MSPQQLQQAAQLADVQRLAAAGMRATIAKDLCCAMVALIPEEQWAIDAEPPEVFRHVAHAAVVLADALIDELQSGGKTNRVY